MSSINSINYVSFSDNLTTISDLESDNQSNIQTNEQSNNETNGQNSENNEYIIDEDECCLCIIL